MSSLMRGGESHGYDIRGSLLVCIRVQEKGMGCAGAFVAVGQRWTRRVACKVTTE
jgi:hypothetical protein